MWSLTWAVLWLVTSGLHGSKLLLQYVIFATTATSVFVLCITIGGIYWRHQHPRGVRSRAKAGCRDLYTSGVSQGGENVYILPKRDEQSEMPIVPEDDYLIPSDPVRTEEYITPTEERYQHDDYISQRDQENCFNTGQRVGGKGGFHFNNHDDTAAATASTGRGTHNPAAVIKAVNPPWAAAPTPPASPTPSAPQRRPSTPRVPAPSSPVRPLPHAQAPRAPASPVPAPKHLIALINQKHRGQAVIPLRPPPVPKKLIGRHAFLLGTAGERAPAAPWGTWNNSEPTAKDPPPVAELRWNTIDVMPERGQRIVSEHSYEYCA